MTSLARWGVAAGAIAIIGVVGSTLLRQPVLGPSTNLKTFDPVARPVACRDRDQLTGTVIGCSRDGTRLLIQKDRENLFILHADGSETQVTDQLSGFSEIPGSSRPSGATISPDGSRVVFAGLTRPWQDGRSCHDGALFVADAGGGPAKLLWRSVRDGIVRDPAFSPDGTRVAFVDGYCDSDHSVWVMNADGSDAHRIPVVADVGLGATHVYGLAWSPAGDRIALKHEGGFHTFASDGSDVRHGRPFEIYCWPGGWC